MGVFFLFFAALLDFLPLLVVLGVLFEEAEEGLYVKLESMLF